MVSGLHIGRWDAAMVFVDRGPTGQIENPHTRGLSQSHPQVAVVGVNSLHDPLNATTANVPGFC